MRQLLCADCGLPFARIADGCVVIEAHHRGQKHTCSISVLELALQTIADQAEIIAQYRQHLPAYEGIRIEVRGARAQLREENESEDGAGGGE